MRVEAVGAMALTVTPWRPSSGCCDQRQRGNTSRGGAVVRLTDPGCLVPRAFLLGVLCRSSFIRAIVLIEIATWLAKYIRCRDPARGTRLVGITRGRWWWLRFRHIACGHDISLVTFPRRGQRLSSARPVPAVWAGASTPSSLSAAEAWGVDCSPAVPPASPVLKPPDLPAPERELVWVVERPS
jgi:hypothetical protein